MTFNFLLICVFISDASVAGAASSQIQSHPQTPHQIGPALQMAPSGVTQYVTIQQRPQQVRFGG